MSRSKIKVLFHSNHSKILTGFGKNMKNILLELYKNNDDIEVFEAANGAKMGVDLMTPWKSYGTFPSDKNLLQEIENNGAKKQAASYGFYCIDEIIEKVKPDIYIGIEDIWAFRQFETKPWWRKTKKIIWTTLDSVPMLDQTLKTYSECDQMLVWASFAEKEMKRLGCENVKTLHGAVDYSHFYKLENRKDIRSKFGITDEFVIGFVFKNQLRKSVPNLLEGFKRFKESYPESKAKLLLHTDWESNHKTWDIAKYIKEKKIDPKDVLCTYICDNCGKYFVSPYKGEEVECKLCGSQKSSKTKTTTSPVSEEDLNEIYNLMDVYCHPFTSGGQELPIQEAKSAGLITLVTNYSCGEDSCHPNQGGLPLSWNEYREPNTHFVKASTDPESIYKNLKKVFHMTPEEKQKYIKRGKKNIKDNFSVESTITKLKKIIIDLNNKKTFFKKTEETKTEEEKKTVTIDSLLGNEGAKNRLLIVIPESAGDVLMVNSLLGNVKEMYPEKNIYISTKPEYKPMIDDNPFVYKIIPYSQKFDNLHFLEGKGANNGYFEIAFLPHLLTQRLHAYHHNGSDKIQFFTE